MKIKTIPLAVATLAAFTFRDSRGLGPGVLDHGIHEASPPSWPPASSPGRRTRGTSGGPIPSGTWKRPSEVPASVLADAFGFTDRPAAEVKAKDLETLYAGKTGALEVGTDAVRLFTAAWIGMPYEPEPDTGLPARAVELLEGRSLHPRRAALVRARIVGGAAGMGTLSAAPAQPAAPAPAARAGFRGSGARSIRGPGCRGSRRLPRPALRRRPTRPRLRMPGKSRAAPPSGT
ncbi:MAG: hypothetical protein MZV70_22435 [Desulfobacterales bacterium]|nr:hypothetical protein [Desulfobacterales bacterium]